MYIYIYLTYLYIYGSIHFERPFTYYIDMSKTTGEITIESVKSPLKIFQTNLTVGPFAPLARPVPGKSTK